MSVKPESNGIHSLEGIEYLPPLRNNEEAVAKIAAKPKKRGEETNEYLFFDVITNIFPVVHPFETYFGNILVDVSLAFIY